MRAALPSPSAASLRVVGAFLLSLFLLSLLALFSLSCARELSPGEQLASGTDSLQQACESACLGAGGPDGANAGTGVNASVSMPAGTTLYATQQEVCFLLSRRIFCARCPCMISPMENITASSQERLVCVAIRSGDDGGVNVTLDCVAS